MKVRDGKILVNFWLPQEDFEASERLRKVLCMSRTDFWKMLLVQMRKEMGKIGVK